jgi:RNA polymerase sigma factor (sigma-70 family)
MIGREKIAMAKRPLDAVLRHIRQLAAERQTPRQNDHELLERFVECRDRGALAALVQRHGPMIRGVCRRLLRHEVDVDDAFQATFLVLLQKGRSIRKHGSLASWLYGVAFRTASKARTAAALRRAREAKAIGPSPSEPWREAAWRELCATLDEELQRLSDRYRAPLVLCYLEGRTRDEAAQQLGWSLRTLQRRLDRGREILRLRLTRRGLTLSAGLLATALAEQAAGAALPAELISVTVKSAFSSAGQAATAGLTSGPAAALAKEVITAMFMSRLTTLATTLVVVAVTASGAGLWTYHAVAAGEDKEQKAAPPAVQTPPGDTKVKKPAAPAVQKDEPFDSILRVPSQHDGIIRFIGTEIKPGEKAPRERIVTIKVGDELKKYRRLKKGDTVEAGQLLAQLDDDLARGDVAIQEAKVKTAEADQAASEKTREEAKSRYETQQKLYYSNGPAGIRGTSKEDMTGALLTWNKYIYETISKDEAIKVAKQELAKARKVLEMYQIRSPSRGVIKAIQRRPGEAVKALETVFLIQVPGDD